MFGRSLASLAITSALLATPALARADAPNDPCKGSDAGAACVTYDGEDGTCQETENGFLECVEGGTTAASGSTSAGSTSAASTTAAATTGAGATTGGGTTTSAASGSGGGGDTGAGGGGTTEEDDGCSVRAPSSKVTGRVGAGLVFMAAALMTARRWRRRSAAR